MKVLIISYVFVLIVDAISQYLTARGGIKLENRTMRLEVYLYY